MWQILRVSVAWFIARIIKDVMKKQDVVTEHLIVVITQMKTIVMV